MAKTLILSVPTGKEIEACVKFPYKDHEISLSTMGNFPTIRIFKDDKDVTEAISGKLDLYGSYEVLTGIKSIIDARESLY